jgi:hypothetical protein
MKITSEDANMVVRTKPSGLKILLGNNDTGATMPLEPLICG